MKFSPDILLLFLIFLGFSFFAIFFGFDSIDSGFILSLSKKLNDGDIIYRDFDYVRPFGSPVFWDIVLQPFYRFQDYLLIICRILVFLQFVIISNNISEIIFKSKHWNNDKLTSILFFTVLGINIFPLMPWHTIDGLFFLSFSLRFLCKKDLLLAFLFSFFALLTKQSFIVAPIFVVLYGIYFRKEIILKAGVKFWLLLLVFIIICIYYKIPEAIQYYKNVDEARSSNIFYQVAFKIYADSFNYFFPFLISIICTILIYFTSKTKNFFEIFLLNILLFSLIIPIYRWFANIFWHRSDFDNFHILDTANALLPISLLYILYIFFTTKNQNIKNQSVLNLFVIVIVWSSSISWGANNIFLAMPFLLVIFNAEKFLKKRYLLTAITIFIFFLRLINPYAEKDFTKTNYSQIKNFPIYSGIFASEESLQFLNESKNLSNKYKSVLFLPAFPSASIIFEKTKTRMPWEMNVEYPNFQKDLVKIEKEKLIYIVDKNLFQSFNGGFYKSDFTTSIITQKKLIDSTKFFNVYK